MLTGYDLDVGRDDVRRWNGRAGFKNRLAEDVEEPPFLAGQFWFRFGFGVAVPARFRDGFADGGETILLVSLFGNPKPPRQPFLTVLDGLDLGG